MENTPTKEMVNKPVIKKIVNIKPGGNDTSLIIGLEPSPQKRKQINDSVMGLCPTIEQVGFVRLDPDNYELQMAGGEFCGNATRSLAYLALDGKPGEISVKVSGVQNKLRAGVTASGEAFAQMPIYPEIDRVEQDELNTSAATVYMEGITQYVVWNDLSIQGKTKEEIKQYADQILEEKGYKSAYPASGVMFVSQTKKGYEMQPVVYVKNINTLFYETACGSGTTAVGLVLAKQNKNSIKDLPIIQPSGLPISVSVDYENDSFAYAQISGPIQTLSEGKLVDSEKNLCIIEQITNEQILSDALENKGLVKLYQDVFSKPPYCESFSDGEVSSFFTDYLSNGMVFLARDKDKVIGFGAALPLCQVKEIEQLAIDAGIDPENTWYMADLGVQVEFRGKGIATELVRSRLDALSNNAIALMRTSENNKASQEIYKKLGFNRIDSMYQEVLQQRTDGTIKKDKRVFFVKVL